MPATKLVATELLSQAWWMGTETGCAGCGRVEKTAFKNLLSSIVEHVVEVATQRPLFLSRQSQLEIFHAQNNIFRLDGRPSQRWVSAAPAKSETVFRGRKNTLFKE